MITETVYINKGNVISLILKSREPDSADNTVQDISSLTKVQLLVGSFLIDSAVYATAFDWTTNGANGQLDIDIGSINGLKPGVFKTRLTIFDVSYPTGRVWDHFILNVKE